MIDMAQHIIAFYLKNNLLFSIEEGMDNISANPLDVLHYLLTGEEFWYDLTVDMELIESFDSGYMFKPDGTELSKMGKMIGDFAEQQIIQRHDAMYVKMKEFEKEFNTALTIEIPDWTFRRGDKPYLTYKIYYGYGGEQTSFILGKPEDGELHPNSEYYKGYF